jgi:hypothetical protein
VLHRPAIQARASRAIELFRTMKSTAYLAEAEELLQATA